MLALTEEMHAETRTMRILTVFNVLVATGALIAALISVL